VIEGDPDRRFPVNITSGSSFAVPECRFSGICERKLNQDYFTLEECRLEQMELATIGLAVAGCGDAGFGKRFAV
jgi:hypothetical protein